MEIVLQPANDIDIDTIEALKNGLHRIFGCSLEVGKALDNIEEAYDPHRKQYLAETLLQKMKEQGISDSRKSLALVDVDLYATGLNYVFGEADTRSGIAIISLTRLRQEAYNPSADRDLYLKRVIKEAVHELGHTFGLTHCPDSACVMHFSQCLADTDMKRASFCGLCQPKLIQ